MEELVTKTEMKTETETETDIEKGAKGGCDVRVADDSALPLSFFSLSLYLSMHIYIHIYIYDMP